MTEIIMKTYDVLDEIKQDPIYQEIKSINQLIGKKYTNEIKKFQQEKQVYEKIMNEGGTFHPDFKDAIKRFSEAKTDLYGKEEVKRYFELEKKFQDDLNDFLKTFTESVSNHIPTPNKLGIVKKGGSCHVR
ncbi:MAG: YlbF family regulator [Acholeplasmataceae bacterium]|nr:YlbF family regulator [Acholeplasmataceae bacterium]